MEARFLSEWAQRMVIPYITSMDFWFERRALMKAANRLTKLQDNRYSQMYSPKKSCTITVLKKLCHYLSNMPCL